jgi:5'-nucleotidase
MSDNLLVITDFDATITTGDSEQCHDVMGNSRLLDADFRREFAPLLDWLTNTSIDGVEWWDEAHRLMIEHGTPPRAIIPRLVREAKMVPRPGALELLKRLEDLQVPVLIVSAGLSDVIEEFLRQHGALSENVTVCSNRLNYEADSTPSSVAPTPPITSFTKQYAYSSASAFFAEHAKRKAILQLGDSLTDVDPARHVPYEHLLSVGFVNERPDPTKHIETFDAVVQGNHGSLLPVTDLLEAIAPTPNIISQLGGSAASLTKLMGDIMTSSTFPSSTSPAA